MIALPIVRRSSDFLASPCSCATRADIYGITSPSRVFSLKESSVNLRSFDIPTAQALAFFRSEFIPEIKIWPAYVWEGNDGHSGQSQRVCLVVLTRDLYPVIDHLEKVEKVTFWEKNSERWKSIGIEAFEECLEALFSVMIEAYETFEKEVDVNVEPILKVYM